MFETSKVSKKERELSLRAQGGKRAGAEEHGGAEILLAFSRPQAVMDPQAQCVESWPPLPVSHALPTPSHLI